MSALRRLSLDNASPWECTSIMRARQRLSQAQTVQPTPPHRSEALPFKIQLRPELPTLLRQATPAMRARVMLDLQCSIGNDATRQLLTDPPRPSPRMQKFLSEEASQQLFRRRPRSWIVRYNRNLGS
jgi:hypothetical protein